MRGSALLDETSGDFGLDMSIDTRRPLLSLIEHQSDDSRLDLVCVSA
jgi:hypothetical protein